MQRFLFKVLLFILVPVICLTVMYFVSDPYRTLKPFSLQYFDTTNRDYLSTELFLMNEKKYEYDSFIFSSSRGCGLNTYHWKCYLGEDACPFLFQAWGETLTGIEQKVSFLDKRGTHLRNVLLLIDIPSTFSGKQLPTEAMSIKDPTTSGQPRWLHQLILLFDFFQKPSQWIKAIKGLYSSASPTVSFDAMTNDWDKNSLYSSFDFPPVKDSLSNFTPNKLKEFIHDNEFKTDADCITSNSLISEKQIKQLNHIRSIFDRHNTDYRIIITPGYCYSYPAISPKDLKIINTVFGEEFVYDYSGKNDLTSDYNNFTDPNHFGHYVGYRIIENIYNNCDF